MLRANGAAWGGAAGLLCSRLGLCPNVVVATGRRRIMCASGCNYETHLRWCWAVMTGYNLAARRLAHAHPRPCRIC